MTRLEEEVRQFVDDYKNGEMGDLKGYARAFNRALAEQATALSAAHAVIENFLSGPPAQMTTPLGLLPVNDTGMRAVVDALAAARAELERAMRVIQVVQDMHDSLIFLPAPVRSAVEEWEAGR